jgi:lipoprotein-anchoring transpeptidase ErfK/SrfK
VQYRNSYQYQVSSPPKRRSHLKLLIAAVFLLVVAGGAAFGLSAGATRHEQENAKTTATVKKAVTKTPVVAAVNPCASNQLPKLALVSISKRHMWACAGTAVAYNSPVVTGMENLAADLTPTGTYHIYGKETDLYLNGSDSTGSWHDYVYYWMPFLDNQYGAYGFHDATWRAANAFGNISPYSNDASHGCVELPLATAKWLYNWVEIGTTVTIES